MRCTVSPRSPLQPFFFMSKITPKSADFVLPSETSKPSAAKPRRRKFANRGGATGHVTAKAPLIESSKLFFCQHDLKTLAARLRCHIAQLHDLGCSPYPTYS